MKKLLVIGTASLAMSIGVIGFNKPHEAGATEITQSTFKLSAHNEFLLNAISSQINNSMENCYTFLINWINNEDEDLLLNFFEEHDPNDDVPEEYDDSFIRAARDSVYIDYLLQEYLLNYPVETIGDIKGYLDHFSSLTSSADIFVYYLSLEALPSNAEVSELIYKCAYEVYDGLKSTALDFLYDGDISGSDDFLKELTSSIKTKLVEESEKINSGSVTPVLDMVENVSTELAKMTGDDKDLIANEFANYLGKSSFEHDQLGLLGFNQAALNEWNDHPETYELLISDHHYMCYKAVFHFIMTIQNIEKTYVKGIELSKYFNSLEPMFYSVTNVIYELAEDNTLNACNEAYDLVGSTNDIIMEYQGDLTKLENNEGKMEATLSDEEYVNWVTVLNNKVQLAQNGLDKLITDFEEDKLENDLDVEIASVSALIEGIRDEVVDGMDVFDYYTPHMEITIAQYKNLTAALKDFKEVTVPQTIMDRAFTEFDEAFTDLVFETYPIIGGELDTAQKVQTAYEKLNQIKDDMLDLAGEVVSYSSEQRFIDLYIEIIQKCADVGNTASKIKDDFIYNDYSYICQELILLTTTIDGLNEIYLVDDESWETYKERADLVGKIYAAIDKEIKEKVTILGENDYYTQLLEILSTEVDKVEILSQNIVSKHEETVAINAAHDEVINVFNSIYDTLTILCASYDLNDSKYLENKKLVKDCLDGLAELKTDIEGYVDEFGEDKVFTEYLEAIPGVVTLFEMLDDEIEIFHEETISVNFAKQIYDAYYLSYVALSVGIYSDEFEYDDTIENLDEVIALLGQAVEIVEEDIATYSWNKELPKYKTKLEQLINAYTILKEEFIHYYQLESAKGNVASCYNAIATGYIVISSSYQLNDSMYQDNLDAIDDLLEDVTTLETLTTSYLEELGEDETLETYLEMVPFLKELFDDLKEEINTFHAQCVAAKDVTDRSAALQATYNSISAIYKLDDAKADEYLASAIQMLEDITDLKNDILDYVDEFGELEVFTEENAKLTTLFTEVETLRDDISSRHQKAQVIEIVNEGEAYESRIESIVSEFKTNSLNYKGDLAECDALIQEISRIIAEIDEKSESLNEDARLTTLRAKLVEQLASVEASKAAIQKNHNTTIALIAVGSVVFVLGILTLLYFFGFKKRFFRKQKEAK